MTVIEQEETVEKYCSKCKTDKSIADFYRNKSRYDGVDSYCKSCSNLLKVDFRKTKKGLISVIYGHQVSHSKARGHNAPNYTKKELINWCLSQIKFHSLYYLWVESNYNKWDSPSCDRKDDYKPYSLNNLQLLTWLENKRKSELDRKNGVLNKTNKAIKQFAKRLGLI